MDNIIRWAAGPLLLRCPFILSFLHSMPIKRNFLFCRCLRYLESCTGPALKRKSDARSLITSSSSSSTSEDDKPAGVAETAQTSSDGADTKKTSRTQQPIVSKQHRVYFLLCFLAVVLDSGVSVAPTAAAVVGAPLTDITLSTKAMSVVSVTSQCSYSSTIVHVPQPESGTVCSPCATPS